MKIIKITIIIALSVFFTQCGKDKFNITKGKVGTLTTKTTINELDNIFAKDSIVKKLSEGIKGEGYFQDDDEYEIYEKGGKHLLTIIPQEQLDSTSTIKSIEIFDERFKTDKGININSPFREINANYRVDKIETSFTSATLFLDELNVTISLDKEDLGLSEFSMKKVNKDQIPDLTKPKSFIVWFN